MTLGASLGPGDVLGKWEAGFNCQALINHAAHLQFCYVPPAGHQPARAARRRTASGNAPGPRLPPENPSQGPTISDKH